MDIYIVFKGEFCTDSPREYMAEPDIKLVTTNKDLAIKEVKKLKEQISSCNWIVNIQHDDNESFTYNNECDTWGSVGIITRKLDKE